MVRILIIDDSGYPLDEVKNFLEDQKFIVKIVTVNDVIHDHIDQFKPNVILMDVTSNRNSRVICKELKSNIDLKNNPVLLMSADYNVLENYEECLADDVIKKPFVLAEVIAKINSVLEVYHYRSS